MTYRNRSRIVVRNNHCRALARVFRCTTNVDARHTVTNCNWRLVCAVSTRYIFERSCSLTQGVVRCTQSSVAAKGMKAAAKTRMLERCMVENSVLFALYGAMRWQYVRLKTAGSTKLGYKYSKLDNYLGHYEELSCSSLPTIWLPRLVIQSAKLRTDHSLGG